MLVFQFLWLLLLKTIRLSLRACSRALCQWARCSANSFLWNTSECTVTFKSKCGLESWVCQLLLLLLLLILMFLLWLLTFFTDIITDVTIMTATVTYFTVLTTVGAVIHVILTSIVAFTIIVTIIVISDTCYCCYFCYYCYKMSSRAQNIILDTSHLNGKMVFLHVPNTLVNVNYMLMLTTACPQHILCESGLDNQHGCSFPRPSSVSRWHRADRLAPMPKRGGRLYGISILFSIAVNAAGPPGSHWPLRSETMSRRSWVSKCHYRKYQ